MQVYFHVGIRCNTLLSVCEQSVYAESSYCKLDTVLLLRVFFALAENDESC